MSLRRGLRLLAVAAAVNAVFGVMTGGLALAHHNGDYLAADPGKQDAPPCSVPNCELGYENHVYYWWTTNLPATWSADFWTDANATLIVSNWEGAFPQLDFSKSASGTGDLRFSKGNCSTLSAVACFNVRSSWTYQPVEDASYFQRADIYIDEDYWQYFDEGEKKQLLAHELGHFYGLHEQYNDDDPNSPACNNNLFTVMDLVNCDYLIGPANIDRDRVNAYWGQGAMAWYLPKVVGLNIEWTWADGAWAETYHQFNAFWWDGSQWFRYVQWLEHRDGIGLHNVLSQKVETPPRILSETFGDEPRGYYHIAWGHPYFEAFGVYGTWTCSPLIFVPDSGLVAIWKMEEASSENAVDTSGNGNLAIVEGAPPSVTGHVNLARHFDDYDGPDEDLDPDIPQYAEAPDSASLRVANLTVAAWVRIDHQNDDYETIVSKRDWVWDWDLLLDTEINNRFLFCVANNVPVTTCVPGAGSFGFGQWYHPTGTFNDSTLELFVNGISQGTTGFSGTRPTSTSPTTIGVMLQNATYIRHFGGTIDEVLIYNRGLTPTEVQALYASYPPP